jgi:hypothetical protein
MIRRFVPIALALAVAAAAPIAAHAKNPPDLYLGEVTCPIDGEVFTAIIGSNAESAGQRLDTRRLGAVVEPVPLPVCPTSGFVVYRRDFSPAQLERARELVDTSEFRGAVRTGNEYSVAAWLAERLGEPKMAIAHFYLEASWLMENHPVLNPQYLAQALDWYSAALEELEPDSEKWWQVQALRLELFRRLGRWQEADALLAEVPHGRLPTGHMLKRVLVQQQMLIQRRNTQPRPMDQ